MNQFTERLFNLKDKLPWFHPAPDEIPKLKAQAALAEAWLRIQDSPDYKATVDVLFLELKADAVNALSLPGITPEEEQRAIAVLRLIREANNKIMDKVKLGVDSATKLRAIAEKQEKNDGTT